MCASETLARRTKWSTRFAQIYQKAGLLESEHFAASAILTTVCATLADCSVDLEVLVHLELRLHQLLN